MVAHEVKDFTDVSAQSQVRLLSVEKRSQGFYKLPERDHMTTFLYSPHWLPAQFSVLISHKTCLKTTTFKGLNGGYNRPEDT